MSGFAGPPPGAASALRGTLVRASALLALLAGMNAAGGQSAARPQGEQKLPGSVTLGPRLLDYRIECIEPDTCRVQCFQHGIKVIDHGRIKRGDRLRMLASTSSNDEIIPRWIEIRSAETDHTQTLLLSRDTTCDLQSLIISPNALR